MRSRFLPIPLALSTLFQPILAVAQSKHWTETPYETLWHGRYGNCDHGYFVNLPSGVVGHASLPPSPNHGILISAERPDTMDEVTLESPRVLTVYDFNDTMEIGSATAYLKEKLKPSNESEKLMILKRRKTQFHGAHAVYVHFKRVDGAKVKETDELVVYRNPQNIGPVFNVVELITRPEFYAHDHALFLQVEEGLQFVPVPRGECSND